MVGLPTSLNCGSKRRTALRSASFTFTRTNCGAGIFEKSLNRPTMVFRLASSAFKVAVDSWKTSRNCLASSWRAFCKFSTVMCMGKSGLRNSCARRRASSRHARSEEHTSELQSPCNLVCRLLLEKKKKNTKTSLCNLTNILTAIQHSNLLHFQQMHCHLYIIHSV